jgi:hypothetical protein
MFSVYKAHLKRNSLHATRGDNWFGVHIDALLAVRPAVARNQFCHCRIPGMQLIPFVQDEDKDREELLTAAVLLLLDDDTL